MSTYATAGTLSDVSAFISAAKTWPGNYARLDSFGAVWEYKYDEYGNPTNKRRTCTLRFSFQVNAKALTPSAGIKTLLNLDRVSNPWCLGHRDNSAGTTLAANRGMGIEVYKGTWDVEGMTIDDPKDGTRHLTLNLKWLGQWVSYASNTTAPL